LSILHTSEKNLKNNKLNNFAKDIRTAPSSPSLRTSRAPNSKIIFSQLHGPRPFVMFLLLLLQPATEQQ
jgi:hypothetical protein